MGRKRRFQVGHDSSFLSKLATAAMDAEDEAHREYPGDPAAAIDSLERFADEWRRKEAEGCPSR